MESFHINQRFFPFKYSKLNQGTTSKELIYSLENPLQNRTLGYPMKTYEMPEQLMIDKMPMTEY